MTKRDNLNQTTIKRIDTNNIIYPKLKQCYKAFLSEFMLCLILLKTINFMGRLGEIYCLHSDFLGIARIFKFQMEKGNGRLNHAVNSNSRHFK